MGNACARRLCRDHHVVIADIKGAQEAAAALGNESIGVKLDISDDEQCQNLAAVARQAGEIRILIHCAGILLPRPKLADLTVAQWNQTISIDLTGTFFVVKAFVPVLADGASVVLYSSRVARTGLAGLEITDACLGDYCAAKAGVSSLVRSFAYELAPRKIRVNGIAPGPIKTPMMTDERAALVAKKVPLGRCGTPEELAACTTFLCSADAAFITGHILEVNGGMTM